MHTKIDHPCVQHKLALIRDKDTGHKRFRELATEMLVLVMPSGHALSKSKRLSKKDLAQHPLIAPAHGALRQRIDELEHPVAVEAANTEAALRYVSAGLGVAIVANPPSRTKGLVYHDASRLLAGSKTWAIWRLQRELRPAEQLVVDELAGHGRGRSVTERVDETADRFAFLWHHASRS